MPTGRKIGTLAAAALAAASSAVGQTAAKEDYIPLELGIHVVSYEDRERALDAFAAWAKFQNSILQKLQSCEEDEDCLATILPHYIQEVTLGALQLPNSRSPAFRALALQATYSRQQELYHATYQGQVMTGHVFVRKMQGSIYRSQMFQRACELRLNDVFKNLDAAGAGDEENLEAAEAVKWFETLEWLPRPELDEYTQRFNKIGKYPSLFRATAAAAADTKKVDNPRGAPVAGQIWTWTIDPQNEIDRASFFVLPDKVRIIMPRFLFKNFAVKEPEFDLLPTDVSVAPESWIQFSAREIVFAVLGTSVMVAAALYVVMKRSTSLSRLEKKMK